MLRGAVIGLDWRGRHITQAVAKSDRARVVSAFDPASEASKDLANQHGLSLAASFEWILADPVIVATRRAFHEPQALAALATGKAILSAAAGRRIVGAAREKGLVLGVGHERRFEPAMEEALTIPHSGGQGKPLHTEVKVSHDGFAKIPTGNWRHGSSDTPAGAMTGSAHVSGTSSYRSRGARLACAPRPPRTPTCRRRRSSSPASCSSPPVSKGCSPASRLHPITGG